MNDTIFILDNGHGGLDRGKYTTAPNKMHTFEDGFTIYEGHFNREIVKKLAYKLKTLGIPFHILCPGPEDTPLKKRVEMANELSNKWNKKAVFISVHANAGKGTGFEVYTSKGETLSDQVAEFYMNAMRNEFPDKAARVDLSDGDQDKEAGFYVLKNTNCPAILTESFFMDRREDAELMMSHDGMTKIVNAHLKTIQDTIEKLDWNAKAKEPAKKPTPKTKKK